MSSLTISYTIRLVAASIAIFSIGTLTWATHFYSEIPLWIFSVCMIGAFIACIMAFFNVTQKNLMFIFWVSLILQALAVTGKPILEDDHYRFLWDGYQFATTGTPYGQAPEAAFGRDDIPVLFDNVLDRVNYPETPTIYAPTNQYIFLVAYWIKPGSITALQAVLAMINLLLIILLLRIAPARYALLYAWSPLVIKEIAFTAHIDGMGAALLFSAVWLFHKQSNLRAAILLALAACVKVFAWLLIPFLIWRQPIRVWIVFILSLALLYLPFIIQGNTDLAGFLVFAEYWEFNPALYGLIVQWFSPLTSKLFLAILFLSWYTYYWWHYQKVTAQKPVNQIPRGDIIYGLFLLISPVINSWYVLWLLPFATLHKAIWPWVCSLAILLSYFTWLNLENYQEEPFAIPITLTFLQFSLIALAITYDWYKARSLSNQAYGNQ